VDITAPFRTIREAASRPPTLEETISAISVTMPLPVYRDSTGPLPVYRDSMGPLPVYSDSADQVPVDRQATAAGRHRAGHDE
jgi:hypothetical protein